MSYNISRDPNTSLWLVTYNGENLGRAAQPQTAVTLAAIRVAEINNPVTGRGPGSLPDLTTAIQSQLLQQAATIEQQEQAQFEASRSASADQGPGTASSGDIVAVSAAARDSGAATQNPEPGAESATITGTVSKTPTVTVPTNAQSSAPAAPAAAAAPSKLPGSAPGPVPPTPGPGNFPTTATALDPGTQNDGTTSYIYQAIEVVSTFSKGQFTQEIMGVQKFFDNLPGLTPNQTANNAAAQGRESENQSPAETQRLLRQAASTVPGQVQQAASAALDRFAPPGTPTDPEAALIDGARSVLNRALPTSGTSSVAAPETDDSGTGASVNGNDQTGAKEY